MMKAVLLLNSDCSISALTTLEEYQYFAYQEAGCAVLEVETSEELFAFVKKIMWEERRNCYVYCYVLSKQHATVATPAGAPVLFCDLSQAVPVLSSV